MQVAIPVWNDRVSPVFESASTLVVLEVEDGRQTARTEYQLTDSVPPLKVKWLVDRHIDVLVCGAIARPFSDMIAASGISVIPWVCGDLDEVVEAVLAGALPHPNFTMPGCCGRRIRARHRGRGGAGGGGPERGTGRGRFGGGRGRGRGGKGPPIH